MSEATDPHAAVADESDRLLVAVLDPHGAIRQMNDACERATGWRLDELRGRPVWENLLAPEDARYARTCFARRGGPQGERVGEWVHRDGRRFAVTWSIVALPGRDRMAVVTGLDVTSFQAAERRRRAEAEGHERERRLRALIEHSSDLIFITDKDNIITYAGPSIRQVLGYSPHDFEGRSGFDLVHKDDRQLVVETVHDSRARPGHPITIQYRLRHADGSWRWMEGVGTNLLREPSIAGFIINMRDITDRRRTEDLLRESEQRFALAVDGAKDGIWDWNLQTEEFYISPRVREILEIGTDDAASAAELSVGRMHPDDYAHVQERWQTFRWSSGTHFEVEYRLRVGDGTYRWLLARGRSVRDADGTVSRMVGSLTDVTRRKRAENEARQRQAELAHVLRVNVMGEMAAGLAHELNQPLAAIVNYARGCTLRLADSGADPDLLRALDSIASEALRAGEVVRSLKRVVRKEPPRDSQIDLNEVARDAVALLRPEASERELGLRIELEPRLPRLYADRVQIEQVILNLLRNALEAIPQRPGAVAVRVARADERTAQVAISDTGSGIPPAVREQVFAPFFTTKTSGLGMGLSISRTIIEAHGGRLWADANPGAGTTFSFTLPLDDAAAESHAAANHTPG